MVMGMSDARRMAKIIFVYFDAGGGHRSALNALRAAIEQQQRPWEIVPLNLQEQLDKIDPFLKFTKLRLQDFYNAMIERGWTLGTPQLLPMLHALVRAYHRPVVRLMKSYWRQTRPEMVVSIIPNFNRALIVSLKQELPSVPYVNVITDIADYPPHFWMERESEYLICGSDKAVQQARALRHAETRIFRTSGMILNPRFYVPVTEERASGRAKLGLDAQRPTGLLLFGGQGSAVMKKIVERLSAAKLDVQLIAICGHNAKLAEEMRAMKTRFPLFVEGFTKEVPRYMHLSDFFIGKPGPASISEALLMGLPVIVERNAWTLPQERYNTEWVREKQVGIVLSSFADIARGVEELLEPTRFSRFRANARAIENRAVFEVPGFLQQILQAGDAARSTKAVAKRQ